MPHRSPRRGLYELYFHPTSSRHMIKNYALACNTRVFAFHAAEKLITISHSLSQCRKRRMRQPRVLGTALPLPADPSHTAWRAHTLPEQLPLNVPFPRCTPNTTKHEAVRLFWGVYNYQLFRGFFKPPMDPPDQKTIAMLEPDLAGEPVDDLLAGLRLKSGEFKVWGPVAQIQAEPPQSVLPKELEVITDDYGLVTCPTHYLAVYATAAPYGKHPRPRTVAIYPVQAFLVALFCTRIRFPPPFPSLQLTPAGESLVEEGSSSSSPKSPQKTVTIQNTALRLPLTHIRVPHPSTFPHLLSYFHNLSGAQLLANLLHFWLPRPAGMPLDTYRLEYAAHIAKRHSPYVIWRHLLDVRGLWGNVMALGVANEEVWSAVYLVWFVVLKAREMQVLDPKVYEGPEEDENGDGHGDWREAWMGEIRTV